MTATILIIDDEPLVRDALTHILEAAGYAVVEAWDGESALAAAPRATAALADLVLSADDGLAVIETLHNRFPGLPMAAMTGSNVPGTNPLDRALEAGARRTLAKPFETETVLAVLAELVKAA